jgi:HNH endonuclease
MSVFTYPSGPHKRRHGPRGYAGYQSYRPWLRDEFAFRCVYCLVREQWGRIRGTFDLDHFLPVARRPDKEKTYDNLLYCCATCNLGKGNKLIPDPCQVLTARNVYIQDDGTIEASTPTARKVVRVLGLDDPEYTEFRLLWQGIVSLAERFAPELYFRLMGFPQDLPDLASLRPPHGNSRPKGVADSYHAQRNTGELPQKY